MRRLVPAAIVLSACVPPTLEASRGSGGSGGAAGSAGVGAAGYAAEVLKDHPIAYWRLGEAKFPDPVRDIAGGHDGHVRGSGYAFEAPGALSSDTDTALELYGSGYIEVPDEIQLDFAGSSLFSIEAWAKPNVGLGDFPILSKTGRDPNGDEGYVLNLVAGSPPGARLDRYRDGSPDEVFAVWPDDGKFHHIVTRFDGSSFDVYIDGNATGYGPSDNQLLDTSATLQIGAWISANRYYQGVIDEVAIYDFELSEEHILAHYVAAQ